jgi:chromosome segregation ATPase
LRADYEDKQLELRGAIEDRQTTEKHVWNTDDLLKKARSDHYRAERECQNAEKRYTQARSQLDTNNQEVDIAEQNLIALNREIESAKREESQIQREFREQLKT